MSLIIIICSTFGSGFGSCCKDNQGAGENKTIFEVRAMTEAVVVMIACSGEDEAERIGSLLLNERLAACVQRISGVLSAFIWNGELQQEEEVLLLVKTRRSLFRELSEKVSVIHTYDVPEIIAVPVLDGNPAYVEWLKSTTK